MAFRESQSRRVNIFRCHRQGAHPGTSKDLLRSARIKGSHHFLRHPDGRTTVVPVHSGETLGPGLLSKILRDSEQTRDELEELLS